MQRKRQDSGLGLANQVEAKKPCAVIQFGGLHDRARREEGLMCAESALVVVEPSAVAKVMLLDAVG